MVNRTVVNFHLYIVQTDGRWTLYVCRLFRVVLKVTWSCTQWQGDLWKCSRNKAWCVVLDGKRERWSVFLTGLGPFPRPSNYWYVLFLFFMWWTDGRGTESKSYLPPADALPEKVPGLCMTSAAPSAVWRGLSVGQSHFSFLLPFLLPQYQCPPPSQSHTHIEQKRCHRSNFIVRTYRTFLTSYLRLSVCVCTCVLVCFLIPVIGPDISPLFLLPGSGDFGLMKGQQEHSHGHPYDVCSVGPQCFLRPSSVAVRVTHASRGGKTARYWESDNAGTLQEPPFSSFLQPFYTFFIYLEH